MSIDFGALAEKTRANRERPAYLIVGSRAFAGSLENPDPRLIQLVWDYVDILPANAYVISGGANGPDSWALHAAEQFGLETHVFRPQWRRPDGSYNKAAGFDRNRQMAQYLGAWPGAKHCTAFWDGISSGTKHTIDYVTELGWCVPLIVPPAHAPVGLVF